MKIANIRPLSLRIPFQTGGKAWGVSGQDWKFLEFVLVRVELADGTVGWGDAFGYNCRAAVHAALKDMIAPVVVGRDASDISALMLDMQHKLHLFGRYGITLFALSGLDIALWDLAGKVAGQPLCNLFGGRRRDDIIGYSSLFNYSDPELVAAKTKQSLDDGFDYVKLHETGVEEVSAARDAAGDGVPIMVDTNCPWTPEEAKRMALTLKPFDLHWLEEPIFPPEDYRALARLRADTGVALASGENAGTAFQFRDMISAGAVDYVQPSVTKVGGVTEFRKVAALAETGGVTLMPHAPYFGPGFLATLSLIASTPNSGLAEWLYLDREACLYGDAIKPKNGKFSVPDGPGLGLEPNPDVIRDYGVSD